VFRRPLALLVATLFGFVLVSGALAAVVHVRVEGKTRTIFGAEQPLASGANALAVLESASSAGEFYYHVATTSFGPYVDQIGRFPAETTSGWVFKVNGVSPPVGADHVQLKDGDVVLWYWATFGASGGPPTLILRRTAPGCYFATGQDDQGQQKVPAGLVFHLGSGRVPAPAGRICPRQPHGIVWASAPGAVRSNRLS
jgi:Domain of unknown function (DUF4430)